MVNGGKNLGLLEFRGSRKPKRNTIDAISRVTCRLIGVLDKPVQTQGQYKSERVPKAWLFSLGVANCVPCLLMVRSVLAKNFHAMLMRLYTEITSADFSPHSTWGIFTAGIRRVYNRRGGALSEPTGTRQDF